MSSSSDYFPLDIWREILVRLPGESLIRTRAVCKGFRAVINDPCFVREHTNNHQQQQLSASKIFFQEKKNTVGSFYSLDLKALINFSTGHQQVIAATPLDLDFARLSLPVASCDGLVLTEKYPASLTIWNPLTHERLKLPRSRDFKYTYRRAAIGLGYDGTTDDYKAVVIRRNRHTHVYSLKSDSWRRIMNCPVYEGRDWETPNLGPGVFVCGGLNWLSAERVVEYDKIAYEYTIVALDLRTEKYKLLQIPGLGCRYDGMLLFVFGGCLAVCDRGSGSYLDVWVMKDYEDEDSWFKLFSLDMEWNISQWRGLLRPVAFIMQQEKLVVFLQDSGETFFMFDVEAKSFKRVGIHEEDSSSYSYWYASQVFVGTIFRLHANCGGGGGRGRKIASNTRTNKKASSSSVAGRGAGARDRGHRAGISSTN